MFKSMMWRDWLVLIVAIALGPFIYAYLRVYWALFSDHILQWTGVQEHVSAMAVLMSIQVTAAIVIAALFIVPIVHFARNPRPVLLLLAIGFPLVFLVGITISLESVADLPAALWTAAALFGIEVLAFGATCLLLGWLLTPRRKALHETAV